MRCGTTIPVTTPLRRHARTTWSTISAADRHLRASPSWQPSASDGHVARPGRGLRGLPRGRRPPGRRGGQPSMWLRPSSTSRRGWTRPDNGCMVASRPGSAHRCRRLNRTSSPTTRELPRSARGQPCSVRPWGLSSSRFSPLSAGRPPQAPPVPRRCSGSLMSPSTRACREPSCLLARATTGFGWPVATPS
jgi:hypothetical protein